MKRTHKKHTAAKAVHPPQMPQSMADLAEGMADDFNNILTTVMGACSLIDKDDPANSELLEYVRLIRASAERAADLSDRLIRASSPAYRGAPNNGPHTVAGSAPVVSTPDVKSHAPDTDPHSGGTVP
jgi:nitrogen-specific signal transduction histidine kinase